MMKKFLIDKIYYLLKKPFPFMKIYYSLVKYYFGKINEFLEISKQKKNIIDDKFYKKTELSLKYIFDNLQFYDTSENNNNYNNENNIFPEKDNFYNILYEMIDDFFTNEKLYNFCLNKLHPYYLEKVKNSLYSINLLDS